MHSSINVKARHSATYADYAALVIPKCAIHSIREIHTLILTVMILVYFAEGYMVHKYPPAITLKVKHIFLLHMYSNIFILVKGFCKDESSPCHDLLVSNFLINACVFFLFFFNYYYFVKCHKVVKKCTLHSPLKSRYSFELYLRNSHV